MVDPVIVISRVIIEYHYIAGTIFSLAQGEHEQQP